MAIKRLEMLKLILIVAIFLFGGNGLAFCANYPGIPVSLQPERAPDIVKRKFPGLITLPDSYGLASALKKHIAYKAKLNKGAFVVYDDKEKRYLRLLISAIYIDTARYIYKDEYFIRASFKDVEGNNYYDIDFWIKRLPTNYLFVYTERIQKKNGEPRYFFEGNNTVEIKK